MRVSSDRSLDMPIFTAFQRPGGTRNFGSVGIPAEPKLSSLRHTLRATALDDISGSQSLIEAVIQTARRQGCRFVIGREPPLQLSRLPQQFFFRSCKKLFIYRVDQQHPKV
jgi:hypothetical protein